MGSDDGESVLGRRLVDDDVRLLAFFKSRNGGTSSLEPWSRISCMELGLVVRHVMR